MMERQELASGRPRRDGTHDPTVQGTVASAAILVAVVRRRIDHLKTAFGPSSDESGSYQRARDAAVHALLSTMAPEHVALIASEIEAREHFSPWTPGGRLWGELNARIGERVGVAPGVPPRYPDAPLVLPAGLAAAYLQGGPNFSPGGARCSSCGLRLPTSGELVAGAPEGAPVLSDMAIEGRKYWRPLVLFTACPLCGGAIVPAWAVEARCEASPSDGWG